MVGSAELVWLPSPFPEEPVRRQLRVFNLLWFLPILFVLGCKDATSPLEIQAPLPQLSMSDAAHNGTSHFYFLPPLVPQPRFAGVFDPARSPACA